MNQAKQRLLNHKAKTAHPPATTVVPCRHEAAEKGKDLLALVNRSQRQLDIFVKASFCRKCCKYQLTFVNELSQKDLTLIRLLAFGLHYEDISKKMHVAKSTWYKHVMRIQVLTGAKSRAHLVSVAVHLGVVNLLAEPEIT